MRVPQLLQLPPDRHPAYISPGCGQLFYGCIPLGGHKGLELLEIRNLMRMPSLVASFCLHLARGFFPRHPCGNRIAMYPKRLARFFHLQALLNCGYHAYPSIITVGPWHSFPPLSISRSQLYRNKTFVGRAIISQST